MSTYRLQRTGNMTSYLSYALAFLAMVGYSILPPLAKKFQYDVGPYSLIAFTMFFLCLFAFFSAQTFEKNPMQVMSSLTLANWIGFAGFAFINLIAFSLMLGSLKVIPVAHYQLIFLLSPIVAGLISAPLLGEPFKIQYLIGLPFVAVGLYIALK